MIKLVKVHVRMSWICSRRLRRRGRAEELAFGACLSNLLNNADNVYDEAASGICFIHFI